LPDPPLPIDAKSGGCDTPDQFYKAWTREHPGLRIDDADVISDNGAEIYSFLRERGVDTLLVMGVFCAAVIFWAGSVATLRRQRMRGTMSRRVRLQSGIAQR
jgi:hypothetical protein